jgi:hypothetical protein
MFIVDDEIAAYVGLVFERGARSPGVGSNLWILTEDSNICGCFSKGLLCLRRLRFIFEV